jgi:thiamine biosynthesis lipoprotein
VADHGKRSPPQLLGRLVTAAVPERLGRLRFPALGTTAELVVTDLAALDDAGRLLRAEIDRIDRACSRFRTDSDLSALQRTQGRATVISPLLAEALRTAIRAAETTEGLVDPTVGRAVRELGYDRDFAALPDDGPAGAPARPAPGWWRIQLDTDNREVVLPRGIELDLGATAKALATDRAVATIAARLSCGVLVSLGGDVAMAGEPPAGGWRVSIGEDHTAPSPQDDQLVGFPAGGLATSGTVRRHWRRGGRTVHHIVDPRTGQNPAHCWRTVTVAGLTCVDANTASTAAMVLATDAPQWLADRDLPARLVSIDGTVSHIAGWPS